MSDTLRLWAHGVCVIPEYTKEYTDTDNGLYMRRAGWGTEIRQNEGTTNWFHFPLLYEIKSDDGGNVSYFHAWLQFRINNDAVINTVHIRETAQPPPAGPLVDSPKIYDSGLLNLTGQDREFGVIPSVKKCKGPLVMCVHVVFKGENGEVVFTGAGGNFEKFR